MAPRPIQQPDPAPSARPRSAAARMILPNLAGLVAIALIALVLWGFAAYISRDGTEATTRLAPRTLRVGSVQSVADSIDEDGPVMFPGLGTTNGERSIVLDHTGDDPTIGWVVYYAYPAGSAPSCIVEQVIGTRSFVDCTGVTIDVSELSPPPEGVNPVVENGRVLSIDLSGVTTPG